MSGSSAIFGISGWSGSGKTTLIKRLIPELCGRGLTVSTIKHAHHRFDIDQPGKDSYRHREAGAREVMVSSSRRWALMHENRGAPEPGLEALMARMSDVDLVLVLGFELPGRRKLEVHRSALGGFLICRTDPAVIALVGDRTVDDAGIPQFRHEESAAIADLVVRECRRTDRAA